MHHKHIEKKTKFNLTAKQYQWNCTNTKTDLHGMNKGKYQNTGSIGIKYVFMRTLITLLKN